MSKFLEALADFVDKQDFDIIRASEIIGEGEPETLDLIPANRCQDGYSVAKAFTLTAVGLAYDKGIMSPDEKIVDIFADELPESGMDERWNMNTVDYALNFRIGLSSHAFDIDVEPYRTYGDNFLHYIMTCPLVYEPGTERRYGDGAYYLLARAIEKKTGISLEEFLRDNLKPLEFGEFAWSHCPQGHVMGATGLHLHTEDMAKLGMLWLRNGKVHGQRLLSEEFINLAKSREYCFYKDDSGKIMYKGGMCGQGVFVIYSQNRTFAYSSYGGNTDKILEFAAVYED